MNRFAVKYKAVFILSVCLLIGIFLRFYNLDINPPGVHADEADSGYNAYSLLKTGRDFYGNFLPIQITGFAENYRTPLTTYFTVPFIWVFGFSPFVIRLPAAILGTIFIWLMYVLVKKIFKSESVGLVCAFLSAVNPWSVHISRAYADHIQALVFVVIGLVLLFSQRSLLRTSIAGLFWGLSLFSYHAPKIFLPLFTPFVLTYFFNFLIKEKYKFAIFLGVFLLFFVAVIFLSLFHKGAAEFDAVSIFNTQKTAKIVDKERRVTTAPLFVSSIFHNKLFTYTKEFLRNYSHSLSFSYLFIDGEGNLTASVGDRGLFYVVELPFLLLGFYFVFNRNKKLGFFMLSWLLIGAIPGSLTSNQMYSYRNIYMLPAILIVIAYGISQTFNNLKVKTYRTIFILLFILVHFFMIISYYFHYFYDYPVYSASWWATYQRQALYYALERKDQYDYIYVKGGKDWPLLYAFYTRTDPAIFQKAIKNKVVKNETEFIIIGKFRFGNVEVGKYKSIKDVIPKRSLFVGAHDDFPKDKELYSVLSAEDWGTIYRIIEVK